VYNLQWRDDVEAIDVVWWGELIDQYGNSFEDRVMRLQFDRTTLERINYEAFRWFSEDQVLRIADYSSHPAMQT